MSAEVILNSLGYIDEELVTSCDELRKDYNPRKVHYGKWISVAACLLVVSAIGLMFLSEPPNTDDIKLSENGREPHDNPVTYTELPESGQLAVVPSETPAPTIKPTEIPVQTVVPETEATVEPTAEPVNWIQHIAEGSSEWGAGAAFPPGTTTSASSEENNYNGTPGEWSYEIIFNGGLYKVRNSTLTANDIGESLGECTINGHESVTDAYYSDIASVYAINNVSKEAAVAIRIGEDSYYTFVNTYYVPENLADFLADFNLVSTTKLNQLVTFSESDGNISGRYNVENSSGIWDALLKNEAYPVDYSTMGPNSDINISMSNELYCFYRVSFALYKEGYIYFNVLGLKQAFYIGEDAVSDISNLISDGSGSVTEVRTDDSTFGVTGYDPETGETTYHYFDSEPGDESLSSDAYFPGN